MSKQTKKALVPELRFPDFQNAGDWGIKPLGDVAALITEKAGNKSYTLMSVTAGVGLVTQLEKFGKEIAGESYKNYYVINKGDFAYNKSSTKQHTEGQIALLENIDQGAVPNSIFTCFRVDKDKVSPYFLKYPFANNMHGKWLRNFISVGARANGALNVDVNDLFTLPIAFPSLKEQQKIADCLTSVDDVITAETQKIDSLKTLKKGLMQQLFPAEGETVPTRRFPEFRDKGDWVLQKLEEVAKRGSGHTPNKQKPNYYNGGINWVSLADCNKLDNGYIYSTKIQISKEGIENSSAVLHPGGAVIVSRDAGVGKSAILLSEMAVSQHFIAWVCDESKLSNWFLYYVLQTLKPAFERVAVGNTIKTIGLPYFKELFISVPSISEQQKIADCLTSIDELISKQAKKIDALQAHKKGLLQQLFPAMDEVSA